MFQGFDIEAERRFDGIDGLARETSEDRGFSGIVQAENKDADFFLLFFYLEWCGVREQTLGGWGLELKVCRLTFFRIESNPMLTNITIFVSRVTTEEFLVRYDNMRWAL